ncbi:MAG: hypothetical protein QN178_12930, partial [Armatimonadota bacterium]|nr:hypothetical protein [Armatimonadota bacterium]
VVVKAMAGVFVVGFHLRSTRLAGLTAMAYLIWVLFGSPPPSAFYVTVAVLSVAAVWELRVAMMIFRRGR